MGNITNFEFTNKECVLLLKGVMGVENERGYLSREVVSIHGIDNIGYADGITVTS